MSDPFIKHPDNDLIQTRGDQPQAHLVRGFCGDDQSKGSLLSHVLRHVHRPLHDQAMLPSQSRVSVDEGQGRAVQEPTLLATWERPGGAYEPAGGAYVSSSPSSRSTSRLDSLPVPPSLLALPCWRSSAKCCAASRSTKSCALPGAAGREPLVAPCAWVGPAAAKVGFVTIPDRAEDPRTRSLSSAPVGSIRCQRVRRPIGKDKLAPLHLVVGCSCVIGSRFVRFVRGHLHGTLILLHCANGLQSSRANFDH